MEDRKDDKSVDKLIYTEKGKEYGSYIEVNASYDINKLENKLEKFPYLVLRNSDAHQITDISEPINSIELEELSMDCLFEVLRKR